MSPPNMYNHITKTYMPWQQSTPKISHLPLSLWTTPFCDVLPKGNQDWSEGEAEGGAPLALTKSAHKAATSLNKSNKSCPCAA